MTTNHTPTTRSPILGVIGGSGIYDLPGAQVVKEHKVETPFGLPSDAVIEVSVDNRAAFFLPRHARGHRFLPSEVNYRANIYALKALGVTHVLAVSAVGIMKESIARGDFVVPDQVFDRTKGIRPSTFFGDGLVGHVGFADPFCQSLRQVAVKSIKTCKTPCHDGGAYICMEGPQFSTRSESKFYRETLSPAVIGMTALPEAKLAREAELCYAMIALATDYDCWKEDEEDVSAEAVIKVLKENTARAHQVVKQVLTAIDKVAPCGCGSAAQYAIMTARNQIPEATKARLHLLYSKYF